MTRRPKWDAAQLSEALAVDDAELTALARWAPVTTEVIARVGPDLIAPSPYQPKGRPSAGAIAAARDAIASAGGIARLVDESGAALLQGLDGETRALIELAGDVAEHGVESPLEVRRTTNGLELLSGHRRLACARLAGLADVPVVDRGAVPDHEAAAIVYRRNLLRKDFTAWQEAISFAAIQRNRRDAGLADSVRAVARALGSSHGRAGDLLGIARAFTPSVIAQLADDVDVADAALARLSFRTLRELAGTSDERARVTRTREIAGLASAAPSRRAPAVAERVARRGGAVTLTFRKPAARMTGDEAAAALALLEAETAVVRARIAALASTA